MSQQLKQKKHILHARYKNGICYITGIELDKKKITTSLMLPKSLIDYQRDKFTFEASVMRTVQFQKLLLTYQWHCSAYILL